MTAQQVEVEDEHDRQHLLRSAAQLTKRYGLAKGTVLKSLREHGVTPRGRSLSAAGCAAGLSVVSNAG